MIQISYQTDFLLESEISYTKWLNTIAESESYIIKDLGYVFCDDEYLLSINQDHLNHDTYTDIITFDYVEGDMISGEVYISVDRVKENAIEFTVDFHEELLRVMSHGLLHLCGYKDKNEGDVELMRLKEQEKIDMFHVKQ